jgi:tellurite resistance protein
MDQEIAIEDLVILHMYQWEALMRVLERKGLLTNLEVMEEIESLKLEHEAARDQGPETKDGLPGG